MSASPTAEAAPSKLQFTLGLTGLVRAAGVLLLAGAVPLALWHPLGPRLVWTVIVAGVPLGFVLAGYHTWRRVCPLAFFATLGQRLKRQRKQKAGEWLAAHGLEVQLGLLGLGLVARHLGANATPWALATLLCVVVLGALAVGFLYTGKTWCNHLCPVGVIEKIYQEPLQLLPQGGSSQCAACTACKKNCPDIDLEQAYWKEVDQPGRRRVYYAWPGLVLGFYAYFCLATGTWDAYFGGAWSRDSGLASRLLAPGFSSWTSPPRLLAVPLTLIACGSLSFLAFALLERLLRLRSEAPEAAARARHHALALAGFTGFLLFYGFAGQPLVAGLPAWAQQMEIAGVVIVATALLLSRWRRSEADHVQEKFAKGLLKRWEWGDAPPSTRLSDLYLMHQERTQARQANLEAYKHTVRDLLNEGVLNRGNLALLQKLRLELGIPDKDHEKLLAQLSAEEKRLFDPDYQGSMEKQLQLEQYRQELEHLLLDSPGTTMASPEVLKALRQVHRISEAEHAAVLASLQSDQGPLPARLSEPVAQVVTLRDAALALGHLPGPPSGGEERSRARERRLAFLQHLLRWRQRQQLERILGLLGLVLEEAPLKELRLALDATGPTGPQDLCLLLGAMEGPGLLGSALAPLSRVPDATLTPGSVLLRLTEDPSQYVRATALTLLPYVAGEEALRKVRDALLDPHPLVRESAQALLGTAEDQSGTLGELAEDDQQVLLRAAVQSLPAPSGLNQVGQATLRRSRTTPSRESSSGALTFIERLLSLHGVSLFAQLEPDDLEVLARAAQERHHPLGEELCRQGDRADEVFLILRGKAKVWVTDGQGQQTLVGEAAEGSCVGEMAVLDASPRSATVTAHTDMSTLMIDGPAFRSVMMNRPSVSEGMLRVLSGRLRQLLHEVPSLPLG